jgi:hypothetical protein
VADCELDDAPVGQSERLANVRGYTERLQRWARHTGIERSGVDPSIDSLRAAPLQITDLDRNAEGAHEFSVPI